jgi:hypothetical protein
VLGLAEHERKHESEYGRGQQGQAGQVEGPARDLLQQPGLRSPQGDFGPTKGNQV